MSGTKGKTSAMVLSGGSVYAAYEVGVIKALLLGKSSATDFQPLAPAIFTGTSAGSINATIMVSQPGTDLGTTIRYLEEVWLNQLAGDSRSCQEAAIRMRG